LLEGLTSGSLRDGGLEVGIQKFEAASLRFAFGPLTLDIGRVLLNKFIGQVRFDGGRPRLASWEAADARLWGVKVQGPLLPLRVSSAAVAGAWSLGPLAAANGSIRAKIPDAHLMFDADVTVPIRHGEIDFSDVTVEHVGPDSRMGVGSQGLFVDAPNGRTYLYPFASSPVPGVEYEQRNAALGPWVSDRGKLKMQAFGEWLLSRIQDGQRGGFTEEARLLLARSSLSGEVQLGEGKFAAPGVQADLMGSADGRNVAHIQSDAVGHGLTVEMALLSVGHAVLNASNLRLACVGITGALTARVFVDGAQWRFVLDLEDAKLTGLRLSPQTT
jgi:hypothetical protein